MKHMKKLASLLLVLTMTLVLSVSALAASGTNNNTGKIIIDNAVAGQTYTIYQILELESYDTEANAYAYKATTAWEDFINGTDVKDKYVNVDSQGYVTWKEGAAVPAFAALAQKYAATNTIDNQGSKQAEAATVEFTGLNLGYYLLDSSLGTLCSLNTTHTEVTIKEKNAEPTNEKKVEEDSTGDLGSVNDADIGQMVKFVSAVTLPLGSEKVIFHDKMSEGLTLVEGEEGKTGLTVYTNAALTDQYQLPDGNYDVNAKTLDDGCTFELEFFQDYLDLLKEDTTLYVVYYAVVNENAVVGGNGNPNESWLKYSENGKTTIHSKTTTYTWDLDILKYGNNNKENVLENAQFVLLNKDKTKVATVVNGKLRGWADVPAANEDGTITWPENTVLTTDAQGKVKISGLDSDTYYLREIKAPDGYNKLSQDVEVVISATAEGSDTLTYKTVVAEINNQSGTELPSTGGMGTSLFYAIGSLLMLAAGVLLVAKKRMGSKA